MPFPLNFNPAAPGGSTALPPDAMGAVFARFAQLLRNGIPACTVVAWENPALDGTPPASDGPPWVRITPKPGPARLFCRNARGIWHVTPMVVEIETSTSGTRVADSLSLWGLIVRSIFPGPNLDASLTALGVGKVAIDKPAWGTPPKASHGQPGMRCVGEGSMTLTVYTNTPE